MPLLSTALESDHDILSLDPAIVIVKAAALIAGRPATGLRQNRTVQRRHQDQKSDRRVRQALLGRG
jgi:hypothetical protein